MKTHIALFLTVFLLNARAGTLLLTGGTNTLTVPAGKTVLFTGSFGGDCVPGCASAAACVVVGPTPCGGGVAVIASVQIAGNVFENFLIGRTGNQVVVGPATVTFTNSNGAVTYRFVNGASSLILQPQQSQTISVPAGKTLKSVYFFGDSGNVDPVQQLRSRITQNARTVEVPYRHNEKNELSGPMTVEIINDSVTTAGVIVYTIFRPSIKLP